MTYVDEVAEGIIRQVGEWAVVDREDLRQRLIGHAAYYVDQVIERCAQEADHALHVGCICPAHDAARRIRALASSPSGSAYAAAPVTAAGVLAIPCPHCAALPGQTCKPSGEVCMKRIRVARAAAPVTPGPYDGHGCDDHARVIAREFATGLAAALETVGAAPVTPPTCGTCGGSKLVVFRDGPWTDSKPCPDCANPTTPKAHQEP